eukprot:3623703-Alexandrium_andersonii.AAC.1
MSSTPTPAGKQIDSKPKQGAAVTEQQNQHVCFAREAHVGAFVGAFALNQCEQCTGDARLCVYSAGMSACSRTWCACLSLPSPAGAIRAKGSRR